MTVKELVDWLQRFDSSAEVVMSEYVGAVEPDTSDDDWVFVEPTPLLSTISSKYSTEDEVAVWLIPGREKRFK